MCVSQPLASSLLRHVPAAGYAQVGGGERTAYVTADDRGNVVVTAGMPRDTRCMQSSTNMLWNMQGMLDTLLCGESMMGPEQLD